MNFKIFIYYDYDYSRIGRGQIQKLNGIFRQNSQESWNDIKYIVFDSPILNIPFEKRMEMLKKIEFGKYISLISMKQCSGLQDMNEYYENIIKLGGEGIILKQSNSYYESGRSKTSLKLKVNIYFKIIIIIIKNQSNINNYTIIIINYYKH
jgi:ATP-dependent DNA ligase